MALFPKLKIIKGLILCSVCSNSKSIIPKMFYIWDKEYPQDLPGQYKY